MERFSELNRGLEKIKSGASNFFHEIGSLRFSTRKVIEKFVGNTGRVLFPQPSRVLNTRNDWIRAEVAVLGSGVAMFGPVGIALTANEMGLHLNTLSFFFLYGLSTFVVLPVAYRAGLRIP
ncbi:MAG: hypothetical protein AAB414_03790 [Patescibacteria group bacterium]